VLVLSTDQWFSTQVALLSIQTIINKREKERNEDLSLRILALGFFATSSFALHHDDVGLKGWCLYLLPRYSFVQI